MITRIILLLFIIFSNNFGFAQSSKVIKVALSEESPPTSYIENKVAKGLFKDLFEILFSEISEYKLEFHPEPWSRAQSLVKDGQLDLFITYPSESRKSYAEFLVVPIYSWDYGYLIYNLNNKNSKKIVEAKSFDDLKGSIFLSQEGVDWENENVPSFIKREFVNKLPSMIHTLLRRNSGDFMIMGEEQARYYAKKFGYEKNLGIRKVDFIPNSKVQFHIGIRKTHPNKDELMVDMKRVIDSISFKEKKHKLIQKYKNGEF